MRKRTAIVIGAGASAEFGLPVGSTLQHQISKLLDIRYNNRNQLDTGDHQIVSLCQKQFPREFDSYQQAAWMIRDGILLSDSIDNFMDKHSSDKRVRWLGQIGIAKAIGLAERSSKLHVSDDNIYNQLEIDSVSSTWLVKLFQILQRRVRREQVESLFENVSFIVFNYDRCIEHFFHWAIRLSYGVDESQASEVLSKAAIFHPYGTIADLPIMGKRTGPSVSFGSNSLPLTEMAKRIRTYTDQIDEAGTVSQIRQSIASAQQIVFLGFSYLPQNMDLLLANSSIRPERILGTAYGVSQFNKLIIENDIRRRVSKEWVVSDMHLVDEKCSDFISKFERAFD